MDGVNKVILIGNLGKDPDTIVFDGIMKATFPLATTESYKNKDGQKIEQTEWHNIVLWRGLAEIAEKFLKKGMQVYVEGKLKNRHWEDKEGNKKHSVEVVADNFMILTRNQNPHNEINKVNSGNSNTTLTNIINDFSDADDLGDLPF